MKSPLSSHAHHIKRENEQMQGKVEKGSAICKYALMQFS